MIGLQLMGHVNLLEQRGGEAKFKKVIIGFLS